MDNPVKVESLFQEIVHKLKKTQSIRHQHILFHSFANKTRGYWEKFESYLTQLIYYIEPYHNPISWSGLDPKIIESEILLFTELSEQIDGLSELEKFHSIRENLQIVLILNYACLNEFDMVATSLQKLFSDKNHTERFSRELSNNDDGNCLEALEKLLKNSEEFIGNDSEGNKRVIDRVQQDLKSIFKAKKGDVYVPVEEVIHVDKTHTECFGRLRKMSVELISESKNDDSISYNFNLFGASDSKQNSIEKINKVAGNYVDFRLSGRRKKKYRGVISYETPNAIQTGGSSNIAAASLWSCELHNKINERVILQVNPKIAITGNINDDGSVVGIESIESKLQAAFFSWVEILVVPFVQIEDFKDKLKSLTLRYPHKKIEIIGVEHFDNLFHDRRIVFVKSIHPIKYSLNKIWRKKTDIVFITAIIALSSIILFLSKGPIDKNPVSFDFTENALVVYNERGFEVKSFEVNSRTATFQNTGGNKYHFPFVALYDITGDGYNEVIWATFSFNRSDPGSVISAFSIRNDSLLWNKKISFGYEYPRLNIFSEIGLRVNQIGVLSSADGPKLIVNSNAGYYFQSKLLALDLQTGNTVWEYVHPGFLNDMILRDVNGNGSEEIILTGVNNAYWNAVIVVLDGVDSHGYAPATEDYMPAGIDKANELAYLLIPKTTVGLYTDPVEKLNMGLLINYDFESDKIWVVVEEGRRAFRELEGDVSIVLYLNNDLEVVGVGTNDLYDIVAKELYESGEISEIPDYEYFERFKEGILYWDGEGFVGFGELE